MVTLTQHTTLGGLQQHHWQVAKRVDWVLSAAILAPMTHAISFISNQSSGPNSHSLDPEVPRRISYERKETINNDFETLVTNDLN